MRVAIIIIYFESNIKSLCRELTVNTIYLVVILIWRFGVLLWLPNLMYANTAHNHMYIMKCHEAMYTQYRCVRQTKMSANVHYIQTYRSPSIPYVRVYSICNKIIIFLVWFESISVQWFCFKYWLAYNNCYHDWNEERIIIY